MNGRRDLLVAALALGASRAWGQLSPPVGAGVPAAPPGGGPSAPFGTGPGFHSPDSPIPPLQEREGVLSWKLLGSVTTKPERTRIRPIFPAAVRALDRQIVKVQGFMMPLDAAERQHHFILSAVPTTCSFCIPAGPEGLVEVRASTPVRYGIEPVVVEGRLAVLDNDPYGLFYRLTEARPAR